MATRTDRQLAAGQRRSLAAMRERLLAMACEWDGRDEYNINRLTELADLADDVGSGLADGCEEVKHD